MMILFTQHTFRLVEFCVALGVEVAGLRLNLVLGILYFLIRFENVVATAVSTIGNLISKKFVKHLLIGLLI